jgi:hypothetical protein
MSKKNFYLSLWTKVLVRVRILVKRTRTNAHVHGQLEFWQNAHVRAMCVRSKIECANVRACEAKIRRNSQFVLNMPLSFNMDHFLDSRAEIHQTFALFF